jgi:hypothetical protein
LGSLPIYSYTLRLSADAFFDVPFGIPEGCRYTLEVHASRLPGWLNLFDVLGERTLLKCRRIESPVRLGADGIRKFDVMDISWAAEMMSDQRRLLVMAESVAVCPFYTIGFADARIIGLQAHRLSISVYPLPVNMLAQGGRLAGRSSVSPQVPGARKIAATALARRENNAGFGSQKSARSSHAKRTHTPARPSF